MRRLETAEIRNALTNLVKERSEALAKVTYGARYLATVNGLITAFDALPEAITHMPLSELLAQIDDDHDAWGVAIDLVIRAIEEGPDALAPLRPAAELARSRYMLKRGEVLASYAVEDQRARDRLGSLDVDAATLDKISAPDGRPFSAWVRDYATAGTKLGDTLDGRADTLAAGSASPEAKTVQRLRADTQRLVAKIRAQIASDLENNAELPQTLEADVLGYFDELNRLAEGRVRTPKKPVVP